MSSEVQELTQSIKALDQTIKQLLAAGNPAGNAVPSPIAKKASRGLIPTGELGDLGDVKPVVQERAGEKVTVYLRVVFLKVGEIDTLKEHYQADVFLQAKWKEPALDNTQNIDHQSIDWEKYWQPQLYVENGHGEPKEAVWHLVTYDNNGRATVYEKRRISGTFLEFLELNEFPFDTQDLTITVTTELSEAEISLEEDESEVCGINVQSFMAEQEWRLHSHIETWKKVTTKVFQNTKFKHPALAAACKASRRPGFFIWNVFFVMLFICSLAFTTFSVDIAKPENRLQLSFILLLTTVTFKFIVNQSLPRISYLTYLDKYILTLMTILCTICGWHAILTVIDDRETANLADDFALAILGSIFIGFHICFVLRIICVTRRKSFKIYRKDEEQQARLHALDKVEETHAKDKGETSVNINGNKVGPTDTELQDV